MALAAGFGIDLMICDPMIFEALLQRLEEREQRMRLEEAQADLRMRMG